MLSSNTISAQHMYYALDVNVGYEFVPILYRKNNGEVKVDFDILNDVYEQNGGGGEEFFEDEMLNEKDMVKDERAIYLRKSFGNQIITEVE